MKRSIGLLAAAALAGCGSGDSVVNPPPEEFGTLNIGLTDAPVDEVSEVVVEFTGVTLQRAGGERIEETFDTPRSIDLLQLQNGTTADLLSNTTVPAGDYQWIRLGVNAEFDGILDSYATLSVGGGQVELRVPGGSQSGVQLNSGFSVLQGQSTNLVIDWDLRKALTNPGGQPGWFLRRSLRVTDLSESGTLTGTVDDLLVNDASCANDLMADTGNVVYVFETGDATPSDVRGADTDPFVTANVTQNDNGIYDFTINFMPVGAYTVAFSCTGLNDDPEDTDTADDQVEPFIFAAVANDVQINDGETTEVTFGGTQ